MEEMKSKDMKNTGLPDDINLEDLLDQYNHIYGQLSALKHIVYSSISLSDPDSLMATVSLQIKDFLTDRKNAVWSRDSQGRFVNTARDGKLLPPEEREVVAADATELPEGIMAGRMNVWDGASLDSPLVSGFNAPSFFPFKSGDAVTGFLVVDDVSSEERDV